MPEVVTYREEYRAAFERLNREWIETWFSLEEADRETFRDPGAKIVAPGGQIFFVVDGGEVLGTCAVIRHDAQRARDRQDGGRARRRGDGATAIC